MLGLLAAVTLSKPGATHVAAPTTVIVQPAEPHTDVVLVVVTALLVLATGALAFYTYRLHTDTKGLAEETHKLAKETVAASKLADQHHQETLAPFIVVNPAFFTLATRQNWPELRLVVENQGGGAAVHIRVSVRAVNIQNVVDPVPFGKEYTEAPGPLGTGKSYINTLDFFMRELAGMGDARVMVDMRLRIRVDFLSTFNTEGWTIWEVGRNYAEFKMVGFQTCKVAERVTTATPSA